MSNVVITRSPYIGSGMPMSVRQRPTSLRAFPTATGASWSVVACATTTDVRGTGVRGAVHVVVAGNGTLPGTHAWSPPG
jgi:hypothetical protein